MTSEPTSPATPAGTPERAQQRSQDRVRVFIGLGAIAILSLLGVSISRMQAVLAPTEAAAAQENEGALLPVNVLQIVPVSSYEVARAYTGEIAALRASDLGFERGGRLVDVLVREGDRVTAGQPIAQLDTQNLQAQRRQLEAEKARAVAQFAELQAGPRSEDIAAAEAEVRDLEQQLLLVQAQRSRREFLHNEGAISKEELDEFTFDRGALQARLERAQSNLAELRNGTRPEQIDAQQALVRQLDANIADIDITIGKSAIAAPFAGLVAARQVDEGTVLSAGQAVVRLVEDATPEARIGLPTDRTARLRLGETQTLQFGDRAYSATVAAVLPEIDPQTRTQEVIFALEPAATPYAKPGQTVRVELTETVSAEGFWLPIGALTRDIRGLWSCYVLVPTQAQDTAVVETVSVEILHQEAERVLVRGTLQSSDLIVADGIHRLVPGQKVRTDKTATPKRLARQ